MGLELKLANTIEPLRILFQQLLKLSSQQLDTIKNNDWNKISEIAGERISLQNEIEGAINNFKQCEEEVLSLNAKNGTFSKCRVIYAGYIEQKTEIRDIISLIQANDKKSQALLSEGMRKTRISLENARDNKKAVLNYYPQPAYTEAWFFDKHK